MRYDSGLPVWFGGRRWSTIAVVASILIAASACFGALGASAATRRSTTRVSAYFGANAIACPTATVCVAGGYSTYGAVIVTINGSTGAASVASTEPTTAEVGFTGIACPISNGCVAVQGSGVSVTVNASTGALGTDHSSVPPALDNAVACPSELQCYAGGEDASTGQTSTLTPLSPAAVPATPVEGQPGRITSLACVSSTRCYGTISTGGGGDIVVIDSGKITKTFATPFDGQAITCFGAVSCLAIGSVGQTIYSATINPTSGNPGRAKLIKRMSAGLGVACATATECFAVGFLDGAKLTARVSEIANGNPLAATALPGASLYGVACSTTTTCWAIGNTNNGLGIVDAVPVPA